MTEHPSLLALERRLLGEDDGSTGAHVEACDACRGRLRRMAAEDQAFLTSRPTPGSIGVRKRARPGRSGWPAPLALAATLGAALLALRPEATTRAKGSSHVELLVHRGDETFRFAHQPLRAGDTLLFRCTTEKQHMLVAGVEASGEVSIFVPDARLSRGQNSLAPQGVRLDDYPGPERVILLLSERPLDAARVRRQLDDYARDGPAKAPAIGWDAEQMTWLIEKEAR